MKIEIRDTDHARLVALADSRGEPDVSQVVSEALGAYFDLQGRRQSEGPLRVRKNSGSRETAAEETADRELGTEAFERLLDRLADEFEGLAGPDVAPLPDEAVSRAGIYRDHP